MFGMNPFGAPYFGQGPLGIVPPPPPNHPEILYLLASSDSPVALLATFESTVQVIAQQDGPLALLASRGDVES